MEQPDEEIDDMLEKKNRAELQEKFLFIVDKNFACNHVKIQKSIICDKSNKEKILFSSEGCYICKKCGDTEELKSDLFSNLLKKTSIKKYSFSSYEVEVSTICRGCA